MKAPGFAGGWLQLHLGDLKLHPGDLKLHPDDLKLHSSDLKLDPDDLTKNRKSPGSAGGLEKFDISGSPSGNFKP